MVTDTLIFSLNNWSGLRTVWETAFTNKPQNCSRFTCHKAQVDKQADEWLTHGGLSAFFVGDTQLRGGYCVWNGDQRQIFMLSENFNH